jgi:hypothetical protein
MTDCEALRAALDAAADWILTIGVPPSAETWRPEYEALLAQIDIVLKAKDAADKP